MKKNIPLFKISTSERDIAAVSNVIRSKASWAVGDSIKDFENHINKLNKTKYAVVFNSGTSALIAMIISSGLKNAEIIVPSFSFISTASSVILSGNKIKFSDIETDSYGLSYKDLKNNVTKKTKGVILMHYSGSPARDTQKISNFCKKNSIILFEDNAHSYGSKVNNINTGTFGLASALSFCQNKLITTGEGGAVVTNNKTVYEKLKLIRSHGRVENTNDDYFNSSKEFDYIDVGYNFRLSSINAAIGVSQIKNSFRKNVKKRIQIAKKLNNSFKKYPEIITPKIQKNSEHFFQQYTIRLERNYSHNRDDLKDFLNKNGVSCRVYYEPIHLKSYYLKNFKKQNLKKTEQISKSILTLPIYPDMKNSDINYIISIFNKYFNR